MTKTEYMVKNMVEKFQKKGLGVMYAKCEGFTDPDQLQGAEPDVVGWDSDKQLLHVGLVADSNSIASNSIKKKIDILTKLSMASGNSRGEHVQFYLGVTKDVKNIIQKNYEDEFQSQEHIKQIPL